MAGVSAVFWLPEWGWRSYQVGLYNLVKGRGSCRVECQPGRGSAVPRLRSGLVGEGVSAGRR